MFDSVVEHVMSTESVRKALLRCVIVNQPLMVFTGKQGNVPAYPGLGWVKILNNDLR